MIQFAPATTTTQPLQSQKQLCPDSQERPVQLYAVFHNISVKMIFLEVTWLLLSIDNLPVQSCPCRFGKPLESASFKLWWRLGILHPLLCILMLSFLSKQPRSEWINPMVQSVVDGPRLLLGVIGFHPIPLIKKTWCVPGNGNPSNANRGGTLCIDLNAHAVCFPHHLFNYSLRPAAPPGLSMQCVECQRYRCRGRPAYCRMYNSSTVAVQLSGGGKRHHITYTANRQQHHQSLFTHPSRSLSSMEHKMYISDTFST